MDVVVLSSSPIPAAAPAPKTQCTSPASRMARILPPMSSSPDIPSPARAFRNEIAPLAHTQLRGFTSAPSGRLRAAMRDASGELAKTPKETRRKAVRKEEKDEKGERQLKIAPARIRKAGGARESSKKTVGVTVSAEIVSMPNEDEIPRVDLALAMKRKAHWTPPKETRGRAIELLGTPPAMGFLQGEESSVLDENGGGDFGEEQPAFKGLFGTFAYHDVDEEARSASPKKQPTLGAPEVKKKRGRKRSIELVEPSAASDSATKKPKGTLPIKPRAKRKVVRRAAPLDILGKIALIPAKKLIARDTAIEEQALQEDANTTAEIEVVEVWPKKPRAPPKKAKTITERATIPYSAAAAAEEDVSAPLVFNQKENEPPEVELALAAKGSVAVVKKPRVVKKKPKTITEQATAQYAEALGPELPTTLQLTDPPAMAPEPLLATLPAAHAKKPRAPPKKLIKPPVTDPLPLPPDASPPSLLPAISAMRDKFKLSPLKRVLDDGGAKRKPKRKTKKATKAAAEAAAALVAAKPQLLPPKEALRCLESQALVFGTSSQLARGEAGSREGVQISETDIETARASFTAGKAAGKGLWAAAARDTQGELLLVEADDSDGAARIGNNDEWTFLEDKDKLGAANGGAEEEEEEEDTHCAFNSLSSSPHQQRTKTHAPAPTSSPYDLPPSNQLAAAAVHRSPPPAAPKQPNYAAQPTAQLAKTLAAYGFKPVAARAHMISLLERCWADANHASPPSSPPAAAAAATVVGKKARGRPPLRKKGAEHADTDADPDAGADPDAVLFAHITAAITTAPARAQTQAPTQGQGRTKGTAAAAVAAAAASWHEKILLYDPVELEELAAWLNAGALRGVGCAVEVAPALVRRWCEMRGVCCFYKEGVRRRR
ncbi:MAG: 5'-flap endonuclease [Trizodia sp. TS-e1964]|nr:MAG: 5'-flap endonuclease [Trizodia sp. TS-e1964]